MSRSVQYAYEKVLITTYQGNTNQNEIFISYQWEWHTSKTLERNSASRDVVIKEPSFTLGGNVICFSLCGKQCGDSSKEKKVRTELLYDPVILLPGMYTQNTNIYSQNHIGSCIFLISHDTTGRVWEQSKYTSTTNSVLNDDWGMSFSIKSKRYFSISSQRMHMSTLWHKVKS